MVGYKGCKGKGKNEREDNGGMVEKIRGKKGR